MKTGILFAAAVMAIAQPTDVAWRIDNAEGVELMNTGHYAEAEKRFRQALIDAAPFAETDYRLWSTLSNLALTREEQGDSAEAGQLLRRVLDLREHSPEPDRPQVAGTLNNLAVVLHASARDTEADALLRRALALAETSGEEGVKASILNNLGVTLMSMGERERAEPVLRRALAITETLAGAESLAAAKITNSIAVVYSYDGKYAKAEAELRRALPVYEKQAGMDSPATAEVLNNLAVALGAQKRFDEAERYLRQGLAIVAVPNIAAAQWLNLRANLAALEAVRGDLSRSAKLYAETIATGERLLGPNDPKLAPSLEGYGRVLRRLHQSGAAKQTEMRAKSILSAFH